VDFHGVTRVVELALIERPLVGEYVLVHGGTAIEKVHVSEAEEIWSLLNELEAAEEGM
jgi:hydrogenase assembly chaperone HypC/HupF